MQAQRTSIQTKCATSLLLLWLLWLNYLFTRSARKPNVSEKWREFSVWMRICRNECETQKVKGNIIQNSICQKIYEKWDENRKMNSPSKWRRHQKSVWKYQVFSRQITVIQPHRFCSMSNCIYGIPFSIRMCLFKVQTKQLEFTGPAADAKLRANEYIWC